MELARKEVNEMGYPNTDQFVFSDDEMQQYNQAKQQMEGLTMPGGPLEGGQPTPPPAGLHGVQGGPPHPGLGPRPPAGAPGAPNMPPGGPRPKQQPVAGNSPGRNQFLGAHPPLPANGPGGSPVDLTGRTMG